MENIETEKQGIEVEDHDSTDKENIYSPVVTSINGMFANLSSLSTERCIYRVPKRLRKIKNEAYTPCAVSIGPLHHGEECLKAMEEHKLRYLQNFLHRCRLRLEDFVGVIQELEEKARNCYAERINLSSDEFVKMILVDAGFIIEVLLRNFFPQLQHDDHIFHRPWMIIEVRLDMTLLENQLPFFVLDCLFNQAFASYQVGIPSLLELTHKFFKDFEQIDDIPNTISSSEVKHFTDFLRICQQPLRRFSNPKGSSKYGFVPSARELQESGVNFETSSSKCLLNIHYNEGELKIPKLTLADRTESFFRNLIAFELCHHQCDTYIHDYIYLMDGLINTPKDVDLLVQYGIIDNWLGDNVAVANLFNNLLKEATLWRHNFYFHDLCEDINAYCKVPHHRWKSTLKREYFSSPWHSASTIAAVILVILTFIQTICSVIPLSNSKLV